MSDFSEDIDAAERLFREAMANAPEDSLTRQLLHRIEMNAARALSSPNMRQYARHLFIAKPHPLVRKHLLAYAARQRHMGRAGADNSRRFRYWDRVMAALERRFYRVVHPVKRVKPVRSKFYATGRFTVPKPPVATLTVTASYDPHKRKTTYFRQDNSIITTS